ncbi:exosortase-associated protein EpsI, V-type [Sphingomonas arenae]|uniref:exosortase-associated protein EpsI, V-type n=1 Tax=Sphingomonas arenae TaxID=2812555 RepID=UPI00196788B5|nr:exosortase-associated protein EpsI, V-type [Sphingomonas arenae]
MSTEVTLPQRATLDRRKFLLGGSFAAVAAVAAWRQPSERIDFLGKRKLEDIVPKRFGAWEFASNSGLVIPPEDQLSSLLYSQMLTRVYSSGDDSIMLLIAQSAGQTGVLQVHRPEVCYPAGGYKLSAVVPMTVPLGHGSLVANTLTATADTRNEQILYWTRIGTHLPVSWAQQRMAVATDNLKGKIPDAVLLRISMVSTNRERAFQVMSDFARQMLQAMPPASRRVLVP